MNPRHNDPRLKVVWVDLDNSPHIPFFLPIIERLEELGYKVEITARDCFQVCQLADLHKLKYTRIGRHYGKNIGLKIFGTYYRALQLASFARRVKPVVAASHGSRASMIAARILGIPSAVMTDYEFGQNIPFVHATLMITPEVVVMHNVDTKKTKVATYPGIKEDVYVPFFEPDAALKNALGLDEDSVVVTIRPPATEAHYHNPESEILFAEVFKMLGDLDNIRMVILPRSEIKQAAWIKKNWPDIFNSGKALIPEGVVDGLNLIWHSDLVVSGGGTMNREAAALGVPVYSIFRGKIGAVDRYLAENGRLCLLTSQDDVWSKLKVCKREKSEKGRGSSSPALEAIIEAITELIAHGHR